MSASQPTGHATMTGVRCSVLIEVRLRQGIADPQGATIERSLPTLGFGSVRDVTVGKAIRCSVEAGDLDDARQQIEDLCRRFLTNPVIEEAHITIEPVEVSTP